MAQSVQHTPEFFSPLIEAVADRIFTSNNSAYRDQFISVSRSVDGQRILSIAFTDESANHRDNYEIGEFFGDLLIHTALTNYLLQSKIPELSPAFLTESKNYIVNAPGQYEMFKDYQLGRYLKVGDSFAQDYNPDRINLHSYSDLVESLFYVIYQFGELMGRIGYQLVQNFFNSHMNENRVRYLERLTKSWKAQLEEDLGKHYGTPEELEVIRSNKGRGADNVRRFVKDTELLDSGEYKVTLTMSQDSADSINNIVENNPVLRFDGMSGLGYMQVSNIHSDEKYAISGAYMKMTDYFNSQGHNYGWRILFSRWLELSIKMRHRDAREYQLIFNAIIQSGLFPYAKKEKLGTIDSQAYITYVGIEYLRRPYTIADGNIFNIVNKVYYRIDKRESRVKEPIIAAYLRFYDDVISKIPQNSYQQPAQYIQQAQYQPIVNQYQQPTQQQYYM